MILYVGSPSCPADRKRENMYTNNYTVVDLETTGLNRQSDEIVEIAAIRVREGRMVASFHSLVRPQNPIPEQTSRFNHITNSMLKNARELNDVFPAFVKFIGDDPLLGHNIDSFDIDFLNRAARSIIGEDLPNETVDSLKIARKAIKEPHSHSLSKLCERFGVTNPQEHRALADCETTVKVYSRLREMDIPEEAFNEEEDRPYRNGPLTEEVQTDAPTGKKNNAFRGRFRA